MIKNRLLWTALAVMVGASAALANSLSMIPPVGTDVNSGGRAIAWSGTQAVVVGHSWTGTESNTAGTGIVYDGTSRAVISSDGAAAQLLTGIGYRNTAGGRQLVAHGMTSSSHNIYNSMNDGVTWGPKFRLTNSFAPYAMPTSNTLGASATTDVFYWGHDWSSGTQLELDQGSGSGAAPAYAPVTRTRSTKGTSADVSSVKGVSANGIAVGSRGANNYMLTWNGTGTPTPANFAGLDGTFAGSAWAISNDGSKIFGKSPVLGGRAGTWPYMYIPAFGVTVELPTYADTAGSVTNGLAYGASADGKYAVGMDYRGTEKAVLWNTEDMTVTDLTDLLSGQGLLDGFVRLTRGYSVVDAGNGNLWITGIGVWSPDGGVTNYTRGFVANVPEPMTMALLALGGLVTLRRRR